MNLSTGLDCLKYKHVFSQDQCDWLSAELNKLDDAYWVVRTSLHSQRAIGETNCHYKSCLNMSIPKHIRDFLKENSPLKEEQLCELVFNKYLPGDWIPLHLDRHFYRQFVLVPLQSSGDKVVVESQDFVDVAGLGLVFNGVSLKHEVPPVQNNRYTLMFLYE